MTTKATASVLDPDVFTIIPATVSDQINTSTGYLDLPAGTTAERPATPINGMFRYNTTNYAIEAYMRDSWIDLVSNAVKWNTVAGSLGSDFTQRSSTFSVSASSPTGALSYSIVSGALPSGQSLNSSTGVISGTVSGGVPDYSSTTFNFIIKASDSGGRSENRAFSITIASRYVGYSCSTCSEGGTCSSTAPGSYVFNRVDFSSYGNPNGSCGSFSIGGCNSGSSNSYNPTPTAAYSIGGTNANWGDPCGGTPKRMYIQMSYGPF